MLETHVEKAILDELHRLRTEQQLRVLAFARSLSEPSEKGVPGKDLLRFSGTIDQDDLQKMARAVEDDCERVNRDEW